MGEIEHALSEWDAISRAAVVAVAVEGAADKRVRACYIPRHPLSPVQVEQYLSTRLPAYMVPNEFVELPELPLDPNGKVSRSALAQLSVAVLTSATAAPRSELSETAAELLGMMRTLLRSPAISVDDDFFLVGGHSLLAARLFAQIEARWGRRLPLAIMLERRTVRNLAKAIEEVDVSVAWASIIPLRRTGTDHPLFLFHAIGGKVVGYQEIADLLPKQMPVYGIQAKGLDGQTDIPERLENMAWNYVQEMRKVRPSGPYFLGGFSASGILSFEVARQLEAAGEYVAFVGAIDSNLRSSVAGIMRQRGMKDAGLQKWYVVRWNLLYARQIGFASFFSKKLCNLRLNMRIAGTAVRRKLTSQEVRLSVEESFVQAIRAYNPQTISARGALCRTEDSSFYDPNQEVWWREALQGGFTAYTVPGTHDTILQPPNIQVLVARLAEAIHIAGAESARSIGPIAKSTCSVRQL